jgi:hypothetical protein
MTTPSRGYARASGEALEQMDMGGDVLRLLVGVEQSDGSVSVIGGLIYGGGPPLHVHDDEDEAVVVLDGGSHTGLASSAVP